MKFGLFLQPLHHPATNPTQALSDDLDLVVHLDQLGFEDAWIGEHHSSGWENVGSPEAFIAAAAERTSSIRFGTGVVQMGLHHPLVALDRMIFLDHLTRGRVSFGMGVGGGIPSDLTVFGLDHETAGKRMAESIQAMRALLDSQEPVSMQTDWFELHSAQLQLAPYSKPHMPFAVASSHPDNVRLMGALGGQVLLGGMPDRVGSVFEQLERGAQSAGRVASRDQIKLSYLMHVAATTEEAVESFRAGMISEFYEFQVATNGRPEPEMSPDEWFDGYIANHLVGSPADVTEKIEAISQTSGGVGGMIFMSRDWAGLEANRNSWRMFAEEVAPKFQ